MKRIARSTLQTAINLVFFAVARHGDIGFGFLYDTRCDREK